MYQGSCLCGAVRVIVEGEVSSIIHCHCSLCRKSSGTAYATNGFVRVEEFSIVSGKDMLGFYETKPGRNRELLC